MNESQPQSRERVNQASDELERQWRACKQPDIEGVVAQAAPADREHLLHELIALEMTLQ